MEGELIAEAVCDAVAEVPWKKVVERVRGASDTQEPKTSSVDCGGSSSSNWQDKISSRQADSERVPSP